MPRGVRSKPSTDLVSEEILKEIKSFRPLRLFIAKQKKKGSLDRPFNLRVKYARLSREKQTRLLQKAVDKYIELLDERDVDEHVQIECRLFDFLLIKSEQKKYFQSINAPIKPPRTLLSYYTQTIKEENDYDNEIEWDSLSTTEQKKHKQMRKEAKAAYAAKVRNFANDLPERLRTDYLLYAEPPMAKRQENNTPFVNGDDDDSPSESIRQRRKSLTTLPESLQTPNIPAVIDGTHPKLTKSQLFEIHKIMPNVLYYEAEILNDEKPIFAKTMTKNSYMRSVFGQLNEQDKLKYITKSVKKWKDFLDINPYITENEIPTLHLLLYKNEDMILYFSSIGFPQRPPINSYLYYNQEKKGMVSQESWSKLSETQKLKYSQRLAEFKNEYYQKLVVFIDQILPSDYMRHEFFRNVKYAIRDYELATKSQIVDKDTGQFKLAEHYIKKMAMDNDMVQFNIIKERLLSTKLTTQQKNLIEQLTQLLYKYVE